jgi:hypothetical protein
MPLYSDDFNQYQSLLSFKNWVKENPEIALKKISIVEIVWLPNKFKNFCLDTESFRLRIPFQKEQELELLDYFEDAVTEGKVLFVQCTSIERASYTVDVLPKERGSWELLGSKGYKCTVEERNQTKENKRAQKKPVNEEVNVTSEDSSTQDALEGAS